MQNRGRDWRTILLVIGGAGGTLFAFGVALLTVLVNSIQTILHTSTKNSPSLTQTFVLASALLFVGAMLLPAVYFGIQRLRGKEIAAGSPRPLKIWEALLIVAAWIAVSFLAQGLFDSGILAWLTPPFYLLAIALPVYFLVRLATSSLEAGSRERFWGALATGMVIGTSIAVLIEMALLIIGLLVVGLYIGLHPELLMSFRQMANQLSNTSTLDDVLTVAGPYLNNPLTILLGLFFFSVLTPLIEETSKSIAIWLLFDHLNSPAQGFVVGALSGAGFGLLESLLASASPDTGWASTLLVRGGSTMMHIMSASITGWGIATFRANKRFRFVIGAYALAMFLHSLWNACVVLIVGGGVRMVAGTNSPDPIGIVMAIVGVSILVVLCVVIPFSLGMINWKFRTTVPPQIVTQPAVVVSPQPPMEENGNGSGVK